MKVLKIVKHFIFLCMFVCICFFIVTAVQGYLIYRNALGSMSLEQKVESIQSKESYTNYEDLPQTYINAVISVEDKRFYSHPGIDMLAIGRAVVNDLKAGSFIEGGSTITQQLAKNLYFSQQKELTRKAAEVFMAFHIENTYAKEEILEIYLNTIYFGDGYYCVKDASQGYFGKDPSDMSEYECTLLAGIPNAPSVYAPTKNPQLARRRQLQVFKRMVACGYYSLEQAETVAAQVAY